MYEPFVFFALAFAVIVGFSCMILLARIATELRKIREHLTKT